MIERLIFQALQEGLAELAAKPKRLRRLLNELGLSSTEVEGVITFFKSHPPKIIHNYPRTEETQFPCFAIILSDEKQSQKFLDSEGNMITLEEAQMLGDMTLDAAFTRTSLYKFEYHILILTEQPDLTLYYYQIAKYVLTKKGQFFKRNGFLDMGMSGSDLAPDARYAPTYLFVRRLSIDGLVEYAILDENDGPIRDTRVGVIVEAPDTDSEDDSDIDPDVREF